MTDSPASASYFPSRRSGSLETHGGIKGDLESRQAAWRGCKPNGLSLNGSYSWARRPIRVRCGSPSCRVCVPPAALLDLPVQPGASEVLGFSQTANASPGAVPFRFYEQSRRAPNDPTAARSLFPSVDKVPGDAETHPHIRRRRSTPTEYFMMNTQ